MHIIQSDQTAPPATRGSGGLRRRGGKLVFLAVALLVIGALSAWSWYATSTRTLSAFYVVGFLLIPAFSAGFVVTLYVPRLFGREAGKAGELSIISAWLTCITMVGVATVFYASLDNFRISWKSDRAQDTSAFSLEWIGLGSGIMLGLLFLSINRSTQKQRQEPLDDGNGAACKQNQKLKP